MAACGARRPKSITRTPPPLGHNRGGGRGSQIRRAKGASLSRGKARTKGTQLEGHAPKGSLQAFMPDRNITGDRAMIEWIVKAPKGTVVGLTATADRPGTVRAAGPLDLPLMHIRRRLRTSACSLYGTGAASQRC